MKRKREWLVMLAAPWLAVASLTAVAGTTYQWNAGNCGSVPSSSSVVPTTCTDTSTVPLGGPSVIYSAISDTGTSISGQKGLAAAYIGNYGGHLGVTSRAGPNLDASTIDSATGNETTAAPNHAMDNFGNSEFIEMNFSQSINLTQVQLGYSNTDSDITVLAYTGSGAPPSFSGETYAGSTGLLQHGWSLVGNYFNVSPTANCNTGSCGTANISTTYVSSYWLIGAYNNLGANIANDTTSDYVKILATSGCYGAGCVPTKPPGSVPEPSSLLLMAAGMAGLTALRRRRTA